MLEALLFPAAFVELTQLALELALLGKRRVEVDLQHDHEDDGKARRFEGIVHAAVQDVEDELGHQQHHDGTGDLCGVTALVFDEQHAQRDVESRDESRACCQANQKHQHRFLQRGAARVLRDVDIEDEGEDDGENDGEQFQDFDGAPNDHEDAEDLERHGHLFGRDGLAFGHDGLAGFATLCFSCRCGLWRINNSSGNLLVVGRHTDVSLIVRENLR